MDVQELKNARNYAWSYFALHAEQRMKLFNFFLILSGLILGALPALIALAPETKMVALLPSFLVLSAFIFWRLDERTRQLVKNGEAALKYLDNQWSVESPNERQPHCLHLFDRDDYFTVTLNNKWWAKCIVPISYTDNFRIVFLMVGGVGFILAAREWIV